MQFNWKGKEKITHLYKEFKPETPKQAEQRRKTVCKSCAYWISPGEYCNYSFVEGHIRPCHGSMCIEKGIYKHG